MPLTKMAMDLGDYTSAAQVRFPSEQESVQPVKISAVHLPSLPGSFGGMMHNLEGKYDAIRLVLATGF